MKILWLRASCILGLIILSAGFSAASTADTNPPPGLTVELRDSSRVIGQSVGENLKFHSALLGDLKLAVKEIRMIDCVSSNLANLTMTNGDTLSGWFVDPQLRVSTSFGKVELPVGSIRKMTVTAANLKGQRRAGLVALWSGEGNGNDSIGGNHATLTDVTFVEGKVGQAFVSNGSSSQIRVPASASLNVGTNNTGFTLEAWVNPALATVNHLQSLMEWNVGSGYGAAPIAAQFGFSGGFDANLYANIMDTTLTPHSLNSASGTMIGNTWQHVAVTYDEGSGMAVLYHNGVVVASANLGTNFTPWTSVDFYLGCRPAGNFANHFNGELDEVSVYNRALTASEIQADYEAGNGGN